MRKVDVLVVGAGPSGLMMAAELTRYGLSCRIVDKDKVPCQQSRAAGIQARTLEVFDHIGIVHPFLEQGAIIRAFNPMSGGEPIAHITCDQLDSPYPFILFLEQSKTERILIDHLSSLGVEVEREVELVELRQNEEGADALLRHCATGKEETIRAAWVAGCDGSHSFVRTKMHLSFAGKTFTDIFSLADLQIRWKYPHGELFAFPNPEGVIAAFPMPGKHHYRLILQVPRCRGLLSKKKALTPQEIADVPLLTLEEISSMLRKYSATELEVSDLRWTTHFHINSRMASSYREGRFFLVGDAAHIHSPVGAQGMNTGLQDAFNLAWKLAFVTKKGAPESLLDTYHLERHSFGKALLQWTERASRLVSIHNPLFVALRNRILSWALRHPAAQKKAVEVLSQTAIRYPKSQIVEEQGRFRGGPCAGERMPNAEVVYNNEKTDLYTLFRKPTSHVLLLFAKGKVSQSVIDAVAGVSRDVKNLFLVVEDACALREIPGITVLLDPKGKAHKKFGADRESVYLIRPDLYVGYRQTPVDLAVFSDLWFVDMF